MNVREGSEFLKGSKEIHIVKSSFSSSFPSIRIASAKREGDRMKSANR